jgi:hypothetical protein
MAQAKRGNLAFDQPLVGLRQRALRLADTDGERAALGLAGFDEKLAEEMRFSRAPPAMHALAASGQKQRLKRFRCRYLQNGQ